MEIGKIYSFHVTNAFTWKRLVSARLWSSCFRVTEGEVRANFTFFHTVYVVGAQNKSSSRLLYMLWYFTHHYSLRIPKSFGGLFFLNVNNLLKRWKLQKRFFNIFPGVTSDALFSFQKQKRHYMYVVLKKKLVQFKIREKFGNTSSSLFLKWQVSERGKEIPADYSLLVEKTKLTTWCVVKSSTYSIA